MIQAGMALTPALSLGERGSEGEGVRPRIAFGTGTARLGGAGPTYEKKRGRTKKLRRLQGVVVFLWWFVLGGGGPRLRGGDFELGGDGFE